MSLKMTTFGTMIAAATLALGLTSQLQAAEHSHEHGDIIVARTVENQLAFELPHFDHAITLPALESSPFLRGWADTAPGFGTLAADEPTEGLYTLTSGQIYLEAVAVDPGLKVWNSTFTQLADAVGEQVLLGDSNLHTHLVWHLDADVLGADWTGTLNGQFRFVDLSTNGYTASDPFTLSFTNVAEVPEPATAVLLGAGGLLALARRRKA